MKRITYIKGTINDCGTITYSGWVVDTKDYTESYTHFISYDKLTRKEIKEKLLEKYYKEHII